jgi:nucleoside-triphosphatase THEP1
MTSHFFIQGDPGIGKSAIAARLAKERGYIHHFNIRADGIDTVEVFLKNRKLSSRMRQFLLQIKLYWIACVWASFGGLIQTA